MPLADGTVLQLSHDEQGDHELRVLGESSRVDEAAIAAAVEDLTSTNRIRRLAAEARLTQLGPAAAPVLEAIRDGLRPRARAKVEDVLAVAAEPHIGGMIPLPGPVDVLARFGDGGVILEFAGGLEVPGPAGVAVLQIPGRLIVRPNQRIGPLPRPLEDEYEQDAATHINALGGTWFVDRAGELLRMWSTNHFVPLLHAEKDETFGKFREPVGFDRLGRLLLRERGTDGPTLLLDVRLAGGEPGLPTWVIPTGTDGVAGRGPDGLPAMRLGGTWQLGEAGWQTMPDDALLEPVDTRGGVDIATDSVTLDGERVKLPEDVRGVGIVESHRLVQVDEELAFLFNAPGRVVRLERRGEAWRVTEVFDEELPKAMPRIVWVDPLGRLCAGYFGDTVAVMWPNGQVPPAMRRLMPGRRGEPPKVPQLPGAIRFDKR